MSPLPATTLLLPPVSNPDWWCLNVPRYHFTRSGGGGSFGRVFGVLPVVQILGNLLLNTTAIPYNGRELLPEY